MQRRKGLLVCRVLNQMMPGSTVGSGAHEGSVDIVVDGQQCAHSAYVMV